MKKVISKKTTQQEDKTTLQSVVTDRPWNEGYTIRAGINAVTGAISGRAIKEPKLIVPVKKRSHSVYKFVENKSQMDNEVHVSAGGSYNMDGVNLSASASFLHKVEFSELTLTLLASYKSEYEKYEEAESYELTDEAKKLIGDREKFRSTYGDYFIGGQLQGSEFSAVYVCRAMSSSDLNSFKASFGASAPNVFSAEGSVGFMKAATDHNISIEVNVFRNGFINPKKPIIDPITPAQVLAALQQFQENESGVSLRAKFIHYSNLDPDFSREIDIAPKVFEELRIGYENRWVMLSLFQSIPKYYGEPLKTEVDDTNEKVISHKHELAINDQLRKQLFDKEIRLINEMLDIQQRQAFYYKVQAKVSTEPKEGVRMKEEKGGKSFWPYGFKDYAKSKAVEITENKVTFSKGPVGKKDFTTFFDGKNKIWFVGWEIQANRTDGKNGEWWKAVPQILATSSIVQIDFRRIPAFSMSWNIIFYYVDKKDYEFGADYTARRNMLRVQKLQSFAVPIKDVQVIDQASNQKLGTACTGSYYYNAAGKATTVLALNLSNASELMKGVFYQISAIGMPTTDFLRLDDEYPVKDGTMYTFKS